MAYGDAQINKFYVIPMKELRERVKELPERLGRCNDESTGLLISLDAIKDLYQIV